MAKKRPRIKTWDQALELGSTKLSALLGCPVTTAQSWIGRSGPPAWQVPIFLEVVQREEGP